MNEPAGKTSALRLAAAWIVVTIPLAWGVYQTAIKALPLFRESAAAAARSPATPGNRYYSPNTTWLDPGQTGDASRRVFGEPAT